jgi:hypothetical protein
MAKKIYSIVVKGNRVDFTQEHLDAVKDGTATPPAKDKMIHLPTKHGRIDIPKSKFDEAIKNTNKD